MINFWWLVATSFFWLVLMLLTNYVSYKQGIWDGAFNQSLPFVREQMRYYDKERAEAIFMADEALYGKANEEEEP